MDFATDGRHSRWITAACLGLLVIVGGYVRLSDLGVRTISHFEMYVPGIRMPEGLTLPRERLTLTNVLTGTFSSDMHPPAYFVFMWGWTKCFGTSIWALRLPSALFGIACIPLVFWLGTITEQRTAGWIAAALLAVNGHHVLWSQVARMFSLSCLLGLLATILLVLIAKMSRTPQWLGFVYVLVVLIGLSTHIFFWLVFGSHVLWTLLTAWSQRQPLPGAGRLQILALILGSPLLAFAAYQSGNTLSILSRNALIYAREFLQFSFMFPQAGFYSWSGPQDPTNPAIDNPHLSVARWSFFFLSLVLLLLGVASIRKSEERLLGDTGGPSSKSWVLAAGVGTLAILLFIFMAKAFVKPEPYPTLRTTELMTGLPFLIAALAIVLQENWMRFSTWPNSARNNRIFVGAQGLLLTLVVVPFAVLSVISLFKPIFNARGMLLLGPYLLLVLAGGIVRVCRRYTFAAAVLLVVIGIANYEGLRGYKNYDQVAIAGADYKTFASALAPHIEKADVVFLYPSWYSTPIFYYLNSDRYRFVGRDYATACRQTPCGRVWALLFYDEQVPKEMEEALSGYQALQTIKAPGARAVLYSPKNF